VLAPVVAAHGPGWRAPPLGPLGARGVDRGRGRIGVLPVGGAGSFYILAVTQLVLSSPVLRKVSAPGGAPRYLMPDAVRAIIEESGCYSRR
jgi:nicotinate-nucleotide adenylyltransferase